MRHGSTSLRFEERARPRTSTADHLPLRPSRERKKLMRVLHVYRTYFPDAPGGIQEAIRQIALATRPHGVESRIFTLSTAPSPTQINAEEGQIIRSRSWAAPASCDLGGLRALTRFRDEARHAEVIHYHFPWPFSDLLHLFTRPKAPALMTYHADIVNKGLVLEALYRPLMQKMLARMQAVVTTSPDYEQQSTVLRRHVTAEQRRVIPLGILESTYETATAESRLIAPAKELGLAPNGYFLFIGSLRAYKGLETLALAAEHSPLPIVIAGAGQEQPIVNRMLRNNDRVFHLENATNATKIALLRDCRALILPSDRRSEAFGMVLIEAGMMGRPAISTRLGTGTSYVNRHDETGLCIEPRDPKALINAFHALMDDDRALRYGKAARERYERHFSGVALGENYANLYREIIEKR